MPMVTFEALPDDARVWVFGADREVNDAASTTLLEAVDGFLARWNAHGVPLRCARAWRDGRFLAIGVDTSAAGASGCSIDGLFRVLQRLEPEVGATLLGGTRVYWRDDRGAVHGGARTEFVRLAAAGAISSDTPVFDTAITNVGAWRDRFERPARESWHGEMLARV